jgi:hypothetical protein
MRTLYLDTSVPAAVTLDGPALRIRCGGCADRLYPISRLARVVDSGVSRWETPAMLACLEAGVTLTFLDREGRLRGQCFSARVRELGLGERLRELVTQPDWEASYQTWRQAAEQAVILNLLPRLPPGEINPRAESLRRALDTRAARYAEAAFVEKMDRWLVGLISAQVAEEVERAGLAGHLFFLRHQGLPLLPDLTRIVVWEVALEKLRFLQRSHNRYRLLTVGVFPRLHYPLLKAYERQGPRVSRRIRWVLNHLHQWLVECG